MNVAMRWLPVEAGADGVAFVAGDDDIAGRAFGGCFPVGGRHGAIGGAQHVFEQGATGDMVGNFGCARAHTSPLARGQEENPDRPHTNAITP